jgi:hypothetical protein
MPVNLPPPPPPLEVGVRSSLFSLANLAFNCPKIVSNSLAIREREYQDGMMLPYFFASWPSIFC